MYPPIMHRVLLAACSLLLVCCTHTPQENNKEAQILADSLQERSLEKLYKGKFSEAITSYERALKYYREANDSLGMSDCMADISVCYTRLGDMSSAIDYANRTLQIDTTMHDISRMSSSYNTLAGIYLSVKDPHKALSFINHAIRLEESLPDPENLSIRYGMASEIYQMLGQYKSALAFAQKAYQIDYDKSDTLRFARRLVLIGDALSAMGNYKEAEANYLEAQQWFDVKPSPISTCILHKQLGNMMRSVGRHELAIHFLELSSKEARQLGNKTILQSCCTTLAELYQPHNPTRALQWLQEAMLIKDSIYSEQTARLTSSYAAKYNLTEKRHTIHLQEEELRVQHLRTTIVIITCLFIIIVCLLFIAQINRKRRHHKVLIKELQEQLQSIQAQQLTQEQPSCGIKAEDNEFLTKFKQIVIQNMGDSSLNSDNIASAFCISQRHLNRRVHEITGQDTTSFIRAMRIQAATKLLSDTSLNITDIYIQCGFESPSYFSKVFKEITGLTPTAYRRQIQEEK